MSHLAATYFALGRYANALATVESVLDFRRLVLPDNHPEIGRGMCGVMRCMCVVDGDFRFYRHGLARVGHALTQDGASVTQLGTGAMRILPVNACSHCMDSRKFKCAPLEMNARCLGSMHPLSI
jgi:hypothetical protein